MKIGFVSTILADKTFEEMVNIASDLGYSCVEVACWPKGSADRRYAGVSHIDVDSLDENGSEHIIRYCKKKDVEISALCYYPNYLEKNLDRRKIIVSHLYKVIDAAKKLGVSTVTTFLGRIEDQTIEVNLQEMVKVWRPILDYAGKLKIKIAIENCPMLFDGGQWPGGQNLFTTPSIWRRVFDLLPDEHLGINYDPSHFIWQQMDYLKPIEEFKNRIFHVHFKDIKLYLDRLNQVGVMGYPLDYMSPKLPGLGDVNWAKFVSALKDIRYDGYACIEVEDKAFENSGEDILKSLILSKRYMDQFVI